MALAYAMRASVEVLKALIREAYEQGLTTPTAVYRYVVSKGYAEKHLTKGFSDPGAYSATINRRLAEDHAQEIEAIEQRLSELAEIFPDNFPVSYHINTKKRLIKAQHLSYSSGRLKLVNPQAD